MAAPHGRPWCCAIRARKSSAPSNESRKTSYAEVIIAIDRPGRFGKEHAGPPPWRKLLDYIYVDTGAMYRALALKALRGGMAFSDEEDLVTLARNSRIDLRRGTALRRSFSTKKDVTEAIRGPEVSQSASKIAVVAGVRHVLVTEQRRAGHQGGVVMEGRDIGSVVFPDAELKIFLVASPEVRAERRWLEHRQKGDTVDLDRTLEEFMNATGATASVPRPTGPRIRRRGGGQQPRWNRRKSLVSS